MGIVCPLRTDARKESRTPNAGCPVSVYTSEFRGDSSSKYFLPLSLSLFQNEKKKTKKGAVA